MSVIRALCELRRLGKNPRKTCGKSQKPKNERNVQAMLESDTPDEVKHILIDYRSDNEHLAARVMNRGRAAELNNRLKGTGMGWSVMTGY